MQGSPASFADANEGILTSLADAQILEMFPCFSLKRSHWDLPQTGSCSVRCKSPVLSVPERWPCTVNSALYGRSACDVNKAGPGPAACSCVALILKRFRFLDPENSNHKPHYQPHFSARIAEFKPAPFQVPNICSEQKFHDGIVPLLACSGVRRSIASPPNGEKFSSVVESLMADT
eukprot:2547682-Rhodomonas_salina.2